MSRPQLNPQQQEELQKLQVMSQQLTQLNQQYVQMQSRQRELKKSLEVLEELTPGSEIYRSIGQLFFKTEVEKTSKELSEELELVDVRVTRAQKQVEDLDHQLKAAEEKLRKSIQ